MPTHRDLLALFTADLWPFGVGAVGLAAYIIYHAVAELRCWLDVRARERRRAGRGFAIIPSRSAHSDRAEPRT